MVFSPANTGNMWGMHAFYTGSLHTGDTFYQITIDLTDWVDVSTYTTYPLRNFSIFSNYSTRGLIVPYTNGYDKTTYFIGGIATPNDVNGMVQLGRYSSTNTQALIDTQASTTAIVLRTQSTAQLRVAHTASAVNYVEVTGSATGLSPVISAQGSDANIQLQFQSKGTGLLRFATGSGLQAYVSDVASPVNQLVFSGAAAGASPKLSSLGSDTNIDLTLTPKGTGSVVATAPVKLQGYTVATLPTAGTIGRVAYVTDATAPTYLGTLTGGGTVKVPVFDNGTAWVSH
jgi:hypothetical protein